MDKQDKKFDVVSFGEIMMRLSPPNHERIAQTVSLDMRPGGAESNLMVALRRLGFRTAYMTRLPDNPLGLRCLEEIRMRGVDVSGVKLVPNERMGIYFIEYGSSPRPNRVTYDRAGSAASKMTPEDIDLDIIASSHGLHLTGITPALGEGCRRAMQTAIDCAKRNGASVSMDVNYRALLWKPEEAAAVLKPMLQQCDLVFTAHRDAMTLFGAAEDPAQAAYDLQRDFRCATLVVTVGENGALACENGRVSALAPAFDMPNPVDRIGAGDAFDAGFMAARLRGASIDDALRYGNALSALKMSIHGDFALISRDEIDALVAGDKRVSVR